METTVNIHQAKTHLSRLVEQAAKGQTFIIAKAGKPMVRVVAISAPPTTRVLGPLAGQAVFPNDIKTPYAAEIEDMFYGANSGLLPPNIAPRKNVSARASKTQVLDASTARAQPAKKPKLMPAARVKAKA